MPITSRRRRIGRRVKRRTKDKITHQTCAHDKVKQESYESDEFFRTCLSSICEPAEEGTRTEIKESDGLESESDAEAGAHYIVLDKVYEEFRDPIQKEIHYQSLKMDCKNYLPEYRNFCYLKTSSYIRYINCYDLESSAVLKICITIYRNFTVSVSVHGKMINRGHEIWNRIPRFCFDLDNVNATLDIIAEYAVCPGNTDEEFQDFLWVQSDKDPEKERAGYSENIVIPTVRGAQCPMLTKNLRCNSCCKYRKTLRKKLCRQKIEASLPKRNWLKSTMGNSVMTSSQKTEKLEQLKKFADALKRENLRLRKQLGKQLLMTHGVDISAQHSLEVSEMMEEV